MKKKISWNKVVALALTLVMLMPQNTILASENKAVSVSDSAAAVTENALPGDLNAEPAVPAVPSEEEASGAEAEVPLPETDSPLPKEDQAAGTSDTAPAGKDSSVISELKDQLAELKAFKAGEDYVENQAFFSAESLEEAQKVAAEYGAELESFMDGIAVIRFEETVVEMMSMSVANSTLTKAIHPDYIVRAFGSDVRENTEAEPLPEQRDNNRTSPRQRREDSSVTATYTDPHYVDGWQWYHEEIGDSYAHSQGITGSGIKVAVIDSGITRGHEELGNYKGGYDYVNNDSDPSDDNGHGTHCLGIIGAKGNNGKGGIGVAPDASLYAYKVLNEYGRGANSNIIKAVNRAVSDGVNVISMSLGGPAYETEFQDAIDNARQKGVVVVASAGNEGNSVKQYPGAYDNVLCVAAMPERNSKALSDYSSFGNWVDIVAPGGSAYYSGYPEPDGSNAAKEIFSTYYTDETGRSSKSGYFCMSGTSMACPVTAGVVALVMSANKDLTKKNAQTADKVMSIMLNSRNDVTYTCSYTGGSVKGMVQVKPAIDEAKEGGTPTPTPTPGSYKIVSSFGLPDFSRIVIGGSLQLKLVDEDLNPVKNVGKIEWNSNSEEMTVSKSGKVACKAGTTEGTRVTVTATLEDGSYASYTLYASLKSLSFGIWKRVPVIGGGTKTVGSAPATSFTAYAASGTTVDLTSPYEYLKDYGDCVLVYKVVKTRTQRISYGYYADTGFDYKILLQKKAVGKGISISKYQDSGYPAAITFTRPGTYSVKYQTVDGSNKSFTVKFVVE